MLRKNYFGCKKYEAFATNGEVRERANCRGYCFWSIYCFVNVEILNETRRNKERLVNFLESYYTDVVPCFIVPIVSVAASVVQRRWRAAERVVLGSRVLHLSSRAIKRSKGEKSKCEHYVCGKREAQVGYNAAFRCQCAVRPSMPNTTRGCIKLFPHRACEIIETQNLANPRFVRGECSPIHYLYALDYTSINIVVEFVYLKIKWIVVLRR